MTLSMKARLSSALRCLRGDIPGERKRLPNKRECEHITFTHNAAASSHEWTASIGRFEDGRLAEVFLTAVKIHGSDGEATAQDAAVTASIALQYGAPMEVLRKALIRDAHGKARGPLGSALDILSDEMNNSVES